MDRHASSLRYNAPMTPPPTPTPRHRGGAGRGKVPKGKRREKQQRNSSDISKKDKINEISDEVLSTESERKRRARIRKKAWKRKKKEKKRQIEREKAAVMPVTPPRKDMGCTTPDSDVPIKDIGEYAEDEQQTDSPSPVTTLPPAHVSPSTITSPSPVVGEAFAFILAIQHEQIELCRQTTVLETILHTLRTTAFQLDLTRIQAYEHGLALLASLCHDLFVAEFAFRDVLDQKRDEEAFDLGECFTRFKGDVGMLVKVHDQDLEAFLGSCAVEGELRGVVESVKKG